MKRRDWLRTSGTAALAGAGLVACGKASQGPDSRSEAARFDWKLATTWPAGFPGLADGAARLADSITKASGGRLNVKVYNGGELVPPFEVFDAVSTGTAQMGHSAAYYWRDKSEASPFFCAVPFGFNAQEMNGWLHGGGGLELWRELYARFGVRPYPAGNTGTQLAGWFNREIAAPGDLRGLRVRIPGLAGEVFARAGGTPVNVAGGEIYSALQAGTIDGTEWLGPWNDLELAFFRVAKYCYFPGWQEPSATIECLVNQVAFDGLPEDLQVLVERCCAAENDAMLSEYTARNAAAAAALRDEHHVEFRRLPDSVLAALRQAADKVLEEIAERDSFARRVYDSFKAFRDQVRAWHAVSEFPYYQARG
jgi:TRAP-type mannitol/chloroaromatic compound transport system substrate-binding protein